jgi:dTDP-glucose 4,6-dehydratase
VKPLDLRDLEEILGETHPLWEQAREHEIFLTGATGFLGAWLLESLAFCNRRLGLGIRATVLSRNPVAFTQKMPHLANEPCLRFVQGDIRSFAFPKNDAHFILHAAASTSTDAARQPLDLLDTLLKGTERTLAFAKSRGTKKFLFISSGAVYGPQPGALSHIPEDFLGGPDWLNPTAAYAEGKRVSEQMCALYAQDSDIEFTIARCFAFVGAHLPLNQHFAIGNFIADALANRKITIKGDGTPLRSYLYGADLAIWLWTMLLLPNPSNAKLQTYNVGSGEAISIRELAQIVVEELNPALEIEILQQPVAVSRRLQYVPDVCKAQSRLGLRQTIALRESIRRTAAWHRGWVTAVRRARVSWSDSDPHSK